MRTAASSLAFALIAVAGLGAEGIYREDGLIKVRPVPVPEQFRNKPWPPDLEKGFWQRANHAIEAYRGKAGGGTTGEHEKWTYPK